MLYIPKHSGIQRWQDFNLDEPEKIYNICLDFYVQFIKLSMLYILKHSGIQIQWCQDFNLDEPE